MSTQSNIMSSSLSSQIQQDFLRKLKTHAARAEKFTNIELKQRVAVPSPQGGYRMEVQIIRSR